MAARLSPQTIVSEDDVLLLVPRALWPVLKTMRAPTNVTGATSGGASGGATSGGATSGGATSGGASGGAMTPVRLACPRNCNARYRAEFPDMDGWSMPTHCLMRSHFARFDVQLVDTGLMLPPEVLLVDTAVRAAVPGKRVGRLGRVSQCSRAHASAQHGARAPHRYVDRSAWARVADCTAAPTTARRRA